MQIIVKEDIIPKISSTDIRKNFLKSKKFLPPKIYTYLTERGVYGGKS
jgi:nicotinic acid mononucleotide adenylyltransferase